MKGIVAEWKRRQILLGFEMFQQVLRVQARRSCDVHGVVHP